jgi:hypothetical protein
MMRNRTLEFSKLCRTCTSHGTRNVLPQSCTNHPKYYSSRWATSYQLCVFLERMVYNQLLDTLEPASLEVMVSGDT